MAIKRYTASKDTTIVNAYKPNLINRATGSNTGLADTMEVFSIYGQASSASVEKSRILVQFPVNSIVSDRAAGLIPASGNVNFNLKLYNAKHSFTVPRNFTLSVLPVSRSWDEGFGLDLDEYTDCGVANWEVASSGTAGVTAWTTPGGDFHTSPVFSASFDKGIENLDVDITDLVEQWVAGTKSNFGVGIKLEDSIESALSSSYTKRFFTRGSEFFFFRPIIEASWDSTTKDNRGNFLVSSSLAPAEDNLNTIYLYNFIRGQLKNIPGVGTGSIYVQLWDDGVSGTLLTPTPVTGGYVSTGIYSASVVLNTNLSKVYDKWFSSGLTTVFHTGSIEVERVQASQINPNPRYFISMPHLKSEYSIEENARFRIFVRQRGWCPNIYTKATSNIRGQIVEDVYYKISRATDDFVVVDYGTGSLNHTRLSYDVSGSYFDFDIDILEKGYMYEISYLFNINGSYHEQSEKFKFRVD